MLADTHTERERERERGNERSTWKYSNKIACEILNPKIKHLFIHTHTRSWYSGMPIIQDGIDEIRSGDKTVRYAQSVIQRNLITTNIYASH